MIATDMPVTQCHMRTVICCTLVDLLRVTLFLCTRMPMNEVSVGDKSDQEPHSTSAKGLQSKQPADDSGICRQVA